LIERNDWISSLLSMSILLAYQRSMRGSRKRQDKFTVFLDDMQRMRVA